MEKPKILFAFQEIYPYLKETQMSKVGRFLPQGIQERGKEIRTFMPRYGCINERRNQLHEVIRLSGMNLIIDDTDHPLIIKVASIQSARMQVYFIDNDDYFSSKKFIMVDDKNIAFTDNDERTIFFCRGIIETVKKLQWMPDIIHANGFIASLLPLYLKGVLRDNPFFSDTKVIYTVYDDDYCGCFNKDVEAKLKMDGIRKQDLDKYKNTDFISINKAAIDYADAITIGSPNINPELMEYIDSIRSTKPVLDLHSEEDYIEAYSEFYDEILVNASVAV
ncbi:MAG: glycogen synthase [Bacteroidetes bacterium GWE2_29_8]|nr:MAG: glycogen synthase [Bacteroidetes bacterium GWE2_29_8]OFY24989.1 MAG: glycogen synthase [Bacteroidetes bacterium GWF2_29_10]